MSNFTISVFRIKIKGEEKIDLPYYPGFLLRGGFGMALRQICCVLRTKDCDDCPLREQCVYAVSFESVFSGNSSYLKGTKRAPHPVIVYPLVLGKKMSRRGATYTFGMTVFGEGRRYLPYYIYALSRLGERGLGRERGRFCIVSVEERVYPRGWREIYNRGAETILNDGSGIPVDWILKVKTSKRRFLLQTFTPLRVKRNGKLVKDILLADIVLGVLSRLRVLSNLYSDKPIDLLSGLDLQGLLGSVKVEMAEFKWRDYGRYSRRQGVKMRLGGSMGVMVISGNLGPLYPILKVGELIHLGKNTAFGFGRYALKGVGGNERSLHNQPGQ